MRDIRLERDGPVTFVVMARPERRNAVDGPMAAAELAEALREFESSDASVAVLAGDGPSFCADADLKAIGTEHANRVAPPAATVRWGDPQTPPRRCPTGWSDRVVPARAETRTRHLTDAVVRP